MTFIVILNLFQDPTKIPKQIRDDKFFVDFYTLIFTFLIII